MATKHKRSRRDHFKINISIFNLDKSINNLSKRIQRLDSFDGDGNNPNYWRGKEIIPLNE
jgi:hypothetical protein